VCGIGRENEPLKMSGFLQRAIAYTIAMGVGGLLAEGVNYWQGTPPSTDELRWLLFALKVGGIIVVVAATFDVARALWQRARRRHDSN
jgi:uncharacterized membrane protein